MTLARTWFHFRPAPLTLSLSPWRGEGTGQRQSGCRLTYPVVGSSSETAQFLFFKNRLIPQQICIFWPGRLFRDDNYP